MLCMQCGPINADLPEDKKSFSDCAVVWLSSERQLLVLFRVLIAVGAVGF